MQPERVRGRPCGPPFPVYESPLGELLATREPALTERDATVAHVLGTCAGYAYSDADTVAAIMARLGLGGNACVRISQTVDAMFIYSTAYLVQSRCGRVVILCYRGTEPATLGSWLADIEVGSSAFRFAGDDAKPLRVHAGFQTSLSDHHDLLTAVRDSGVGFSEEGLRRIFEPFYTTKPHGMGIGLSISRSIVEAHSGRLWAARNDDAPGATIAFMLPLHEPPHG